MALEFLLMNNSSQLPKVTLSDDSFLQIIHALNYLEEKTGVKIDQYSDTRISPEHSKILLSVIGISKSELERDINDLLVMLKVASESSLWVQTIGD